MTTELEQTTGSFDALEVEAAFRKQVQQELRVQRLAVLNVAEDEARARKKAEVDKKALAKMNAELQQEIVNRKTIEEGLRAQRLAALNVAEDEEKARKQCEEDEKALAKMNAELQQEIANRERVQNELEHAAEEVRKSGEYVENIIGSMIDMLVAVAPDGTIRRVNEATCSVLGYTQEELIGRPASLLFSEEEEEEEEDATQLIVSQEALPFKRIVLRRLVKDGAISNIEKSLRAKSGHAIPALMSGSVMRDNDGTIRGIVCVAQDITERKKAERELAKAHQELLETSRQAGMAEVATGVLHNVGNVLNSVNVSAALVSEKLRRSKVANLAKAAELMSEHADDLATFIANDEKGRHFPAYLTMLAEHLAKEQAETIEELGSLTENVEHIKAIVSMQQSYAGMSGLVAQVNVTEVLDDVLRMNAISSERHGIVVVREYDEIPPVVVEKHKLLQILVNLVRNAADALVESGAHKKRLTVRMDMSGGNRLRIEVVDNGIGIAREDLARIFAHGYTTKKDGHGFGLHGAALMAKDMGGSLTAHSDGPGKGATFTLELPLEPAMVNA